MVAFIIFSQNSIMAKLDAGSTFERLRNRYRLVIMNDDTYEEVVTFRLSRLSVYIGLSTVFVVLVGLTVALIVFTPLKYYIPGYGSAKVGREYRQLKYVTDSLEQQVTYQAQYIDQIKKVLSGDVPVKLDTTNLRETILQQQCHANQRRYYFKR
jgi:hypothetical protein